MTTTDSNHTQPVAENVLDRDFAAETRNQKWVADITYIATLEGWLYLAAVIDLFSRKVVGWSMSERIDSRLVVDALEMAIARELPEAGLVAHSEFMKLARPPARACSSTSKYSTTANVDTRPWALCPRSPLRKPRNRL